MTRDDITPPITSKHLEEVLDNPAYERKVISEGLLYEKTCLLINSDPGIGKSTISTQIAVELAAGLPVLGFFHTPQPIKVLYIQCERSILETIERLRVLKKFYPINSSNLAITDEFQRLDFLNINHVNLFLECLARDFPKVDLIILDPIYAMVSGGLKDDRPATFFTRLIRYVQKQFGCSFWLNHHTVKAQYDSQGKEVIRRHRFYGAQWILAAVTGSYDMSAKDHKQPAKGVILECEKDNYSILTKHIDLEYDPDTGLCTVNSAELGALDKVRNFILTHKISKKPFSFPEIMEFTKLSPRSIRYFLAHPEVRNTVISEALSHNKFIYRAL